MRKSILISTILAYQLSAVTIEKVTVSTEAEGESKSLYSEEIKFTKQLDVAKILSETLPEINHIRASGVGSDIILRGFRKDNINVLIDGGKICGACPNRMDPPAMHISASDIESIEVKEGVFDVENFGSLAGVIDVKTKEPKSKPNAQVDLSLGSFGYKKGSLNLGAGSETLKFSLGYSYEESDQYEDGDGKTLAEQVEEISALEGTKYKSEFKDAKAFERESLWLKSLINLSENQTLSINYFRDSTDDALYPAFGMDAQIDESDMVNIKYSYKDFRAKYYYSKVEHEMGTEFRKASNDPALFRTHRVESRISGIKLAKDFNLDEYRFTLGVDGSDRNWYGNCLSEPEPRKLKQVRIPDVTTKNRALFGKLHRSLDNIDISLGVRADMTKISADRGVIHSASNIDMAKMAISKYYQGSEGRDYKSLSANILTRYNFNSDSSIYVGVGESSRVPDAKEMYFISFMDGVWKIAGNPNLEQTINREVDLGFDTLLTESTSFNLNLFYSDLKDFIYMHKVTSNEKIGSTFSNIDATIYGFDASLSHSFTNSIWLDVALAYQRGEKSDNSIGEDRDLAEIPPLKTRVALTYDDSKYFGSLALISALKQDNIDSENGEREIDGYSTLNLKLGYNFNRNLSFNIGLDNILDETYAVNNSYIGRGVIASTPTDVMVLNESGRYLYTNLRYQF